MARARGGPRRERQAVGLLAVLGLLGGCDPGLVTLGPTPIAVGSSTRVSFMDFCTKDGKEHTTTVYRCTDETPTEVLSATVGAPFEVLGSDTSGVALKANAVGRSRLVADVRVKTGETRRVETSLEARAIDTVRVQPRCTFPVGSPLPLAAMTWLEVGHSAQGGGTTLGTGGLQPLQAEDLTLGEWTTGRVRFRGAVPGPARLTSPHDPSLAFDVEVIAPTAITVGWKPVDTRIRANYGGTRLQATATTQGRNLCGLPGGTWTATVKTPGICDLAHVSATNTSPMSSEYAASATLVEGNNPMFSVRGRSVGTCTVEVRDASARWVTELQLTVW